MTDRPEMILFGLVASAVGFLSAKLAKTERVRGAAVFLKYSGIGVAVWALIGLFWK